MCIKEIQCPHCGNEDVKRIQLCVVLPSSIYRNLYQDDRGLIWRKRKLTLSKRNQSSNGISLLPKL